MQDSDPTHILKEKSVPSDLRLKAILRLVTLEDSHENINTLLHILNIFEEVLSDESDTAEVRSAVALALGKIGHEKAVDILIDKAATHDTTVRQYVLDALGNTKSSKAVPTLIHALSDQSNNVFATAAEALGRIGRPAVPHLIDLLENGADDARCVAAWQLGEIKDSKALPKLVEIVKTESNVEVTALCVWALGNIGVSQDDVMEVLFWARKQEEPEIRLRADSAIKKIARHVN